MYIEIMLVGIRIFALAANHFRKIDEHIAVPVLLRRREHFGVRIAPGLALCEIRLGHMHGTFDRLDLDRALGTRDDKLTAHKATALGGRRFGKGDSVFILENGKTYIEDILSSYDKSSEEYKKLAQWVEKPTIV